MQTVLPQRGVYDGMEELILSLPNMWADHHVLDVHKVLDELGVAQCEASAAHKAVRLSYDPETVRRETILQALAQAGYTPTEVTEFPQPLANKEQGSPWFVHGLRVTQTNRLDLEMSGDFRKY
jgi:copper chaperone CopZ